MLPTIKQIKPKETTLISFLLTRFVRIKSFMINRLSIGAKKNTSVKLINTSQPQWRGVSWLHAITGRINPQSQSKRIKIGLRVYRGRFCLSPLIISKCRPNEAIRKIAPRISRILAIQIVFRGWSIYLIWSACFDNMEYLNSCLKLANL